MILLNTLREVVSNGTTRLSGSSLRARSARGAMTVGAGTVLERGSRLIRNMILARLLAPKEFGLMAIMVALSTIVDSFTDIGVKQSVIQNKKGADAEYLNASWWVQILRGLVMYVIVYCMSPLVGKFYGNNDFSLLLRIAFISVPLRSMISPGTYVLEKEIRFGRIILLGTGSGLLGTISTLLLAIFVVRGVWALVLGFVFEAFFMCFLSFCVCPFFPKLSLDKNSLNSILSYAKGMVGLPLLTLLANQTDVILLGKIVTTSQLGMYSMALSLSQQPTSLIFGIIGPILLPAFSKKQDEKGVLGQALLKVIKISIFLCLPVTIVLIVFARSILAVAYGASYTAVTTPFIVLCIVMLIRMEGGILSCIYFAVGKPHLQRRYLILLLFLVLSLIYPGAKFFGLVGASCVLLISYTTAFLMQIVWVKKVVGLKFMDYLTCWVPTSWFISNI